MSGSRVAVATVRRAAWLVPGVVALAIAWSAAVPAWAAPGSADLSVTGPTAGISTAVTRSFSWVLTVKNNGPDDGNGSKLTSTAPTGLQFTGATSTAGSCSTTSGLDCNLGRLSNAETATVTVTVKATTAGTKTLTAATSTAAADSVAANNTASVQVTVEACTIVGTEAAETLTGTAGVDVICGLGGNDIIKGGGGDDILKGGAGADIIKGGPGADWMSGGIGADTLIGGLGKDRLYGNAGRDFFNTKDGLVDRLYGGTGTDRARSDRLLDVRSSIERLS